MGSKRLRNSDKKAARAKAEAKRKSDEAMRFKVKTAGSPMSQIHTYICNADKSFSQKINSRHHHLKV